MFRGLILLMGGHKSLQHNARGVDYFYARNR